MSYTVIGQEIQQSPDINLADVFDSTEDDLRINKHAKEKIQYDSRFVPLSVLGCEPEILATNEQNPELIMLAKESIDSDNDDSENFFEIDSPNIEIPFPPQAPVIDIKVTTVQKNIHYKRKNPLNPPEADEVTIHNLSKNIDNQPKFLGIGKNRAMTAHH